MYIYLFNFVVAFPFNPVPLTLIHIVHAMNKVSYEPFNNRIYDSSTLHVEHFWVTGCLMLKLLAFDNNTVLFQNFGQE